MSQRPKTGKQSLMSGGARKEQLIDAAVSVFAAKGYQKASIADIIDAAGVARGTFYLHLDSKLDAFHAVMERYVRLFDERVRQEAAKSYDDPHEVRRNVRASLIDWLRFYAQNRDLAKVVLREAPTIDLGYQQRCHEMMASCFQNWTRSLNMLKDLGAVRRDVDPGFLNTVLTGVLVHLVLTYVLSEPDRDLEWLADQWLELVEFGVVAKTWSP
jgi:AcrR family transcriptional regulator